MGETVSVTTRRYHTHNGAEHYIGDVYDVPADQVANLVGQGMVTLSQEPAAPPAKPSQPVQPMTTDDVGMKPKAKKS